MGFSSCAQAWGEPRGGLMGKLGTLAASGTDTARWKKGLQALGSKTKEGVSSLSSATKSATAHSLSAVSHASQAASHAVSARLTHDPAGALASPAAVAALLGGSNSLPLAGCLHREAGLRSQLAGLPPPAGILGPGTPKIQKI